jgi:hypothetical protein
MHAIRAFLDNIRAGARLAFLLPLRPNSFRAGADQAALLILIAVAARFGYEYLTNGPEPTFNRAGLTYLAAMYLFFLLGLYLVACLQRAPASARALLVVTMAASLTLFLVYGLLWWLTQGEARLDQGFASAAPIVLGIVTIALFVWPAVLSFRSMRVVFAISRRRAAMLAALFLAVSYSPRYLLSEEPLFYDGSDDGVASPYAALDVERTYYAQPRLLAETAGSLRPQRPGVVDLYFVGFGGYAYQDVFLSEVTAVQELFDDRFDTVDRSVVLVNNRATADYLPLANANNLRLTLERVAEVMDPEEDVLFLFLTSHGSRDHRLSVDFWPLQLNDLPARDLKQILDESGIKWRVVVVSACYSGGFIDALKDENSLIMTASRADRNSFGCAHENEFTYFGQAYFNEQLRAEFSFIEAFNKSALRIRQRELSEGLTQSYPQVHIGPAARAKLYELEQRVRTRARAARASALGIEPVWD